MMTVLSFVLAKQLPGISTKPVEILIDSRLEQSWNAESPIVVIVLGIVIDVKEPPLNALDKIPVTGRPLYVSGISRVDSE